MIKTFFKHFVFEKCINVGFREVTKNFRKPPNKPISHGIGSQVTELARKSGLNVNVHSRYEEVANLLGAEKYYRKVKFGDLNDELSGNSSN